MAEGRAHPNRSFFEEMATRMKLCPLAVGLLPRRVSEFPNDFFFREVLVR